MKKFAVILSGCGHLDGAEIHEATLSLWAIHKNGGDFHCFAPNKNQHHVVNHCTGAEMTGERNMMVEAARIARGKISLMTEFTPADYDAVVIPGGFGAAKNLCNYAFAGDAMEVDGEVKDALLAAHKAGLPLGALCIAPMIFAKLFSGASLTLGGHSNASQDAETLGAQHKITSHGEVAIDKERKLVTTPCYMLDSRVDQIGDGADALVKALLTLMK